MPRAASRPLPRRSCQTLAPLRTIESFEVQAMVNDQLANYSYEAPSPDATIGAPWSAERVSSCLAERRRQLVAPYRSLLHVLETDRAIAPKNLSNEVWIVWEHGSYLVFFDPSTEVFGLAAWQTDSEAPTFWGVHGDLIYVLCAVQGRPAATAGPASQSTRDRAPWRLTPPSSGRPRASFAVSRSPLMSNVRHLK